MTNSRDAFASVCADQALIEETAARLQALREQRETRRPRALPARAAALAAAALMLIIAVSWPVWFAATAHIAIDINPSVELTLNRFDRVIRAEAFNEDGARVLKTLSLNGKTCVSATAEVLAAAVREGYLGGGTLVSVSVQSSGETRGQALYNALWDVVNTEVEQIAEVEVLAVTTEVWEHASDCHMSPAKYLALQELMQADETAVWEEYADAPIGQIRQRTAECTQAHGAHGQAGGHGHHGGH